MTVNTVYQIAGHEFAKDLIFGWCADGFPVDQLGLEEVQVIIEIASSNKILLSELGDAAVKRKEELLSQPLNCGEVLVPDRVPVFAITVCARDKQVEDKVELILNMSPDGTYKGEKYFFVSKDENDLYTITGHGGRIRTEGKNLKDTAEYLIDNW